MNPTPSIKSSQDLLASLSKAKDKLINKGELRTNSRKDIPSTPTKLFRIPNHWEWTFLDQISIIQEGPGIRKHQYTKSGVQFLTVTNILEGSVDIYKSEKFISKDEYDSKYKHFTLRKGDIVTACSGGSWGKSAIFDADIKMILNTSTLRLRFFDDLGENRYLYYLTKSYFFKKQIADQLSGQQPNFGISHYSIISIPLPPLEEQKRIVKILDETFAAIDKAIENTERNLENAKELFESSSQTLFFKAKKYRAKHLIELAENCDSQRIPITKSKRKLGVFPYYGASGIVDYVEDYIFDGDYLLVSEDGANLLARSTPIAFSVSGQFWVNNHAHILKFPNMATQKYVELFLESIHLDDYITGAAQPKLNQTALNSIEIFIPDSIKDQKEAVTKLLNLKNKIFESNEAYKRKILQLKELKQSILQKAFTGELTTDNKTKKRVA